MKDINKMTQSKLLELQQQLAKLLAADAAPELKNNNNNRRKDIKPLPLLQEEIEKQKDEKLIKHNIVIDDDGSYKVSKIDDEFVYVYNRKKDFKVFSRMTTTDTLVLDKMLSSMSYAGDEFGGQCVQLHSWQLEKMADELNINVRKIRETIKKLREGNVITNVVLHEKSGKIKEIKAVVQVNPFLFAKGSVKDIINLRTMFVNKASRMCKDVDYYERGE